MKRIRDDRLSVHCLPLLGEVGAVCLVLSCTPPGSLSQEAKPQPTTPPPTALGSFTDHLTALNTDRWIRADGWRYPSPFDCGWRADHVQFDGNVMTLELDDTQTSGAPYSSGEYHSTGFYAYGCYEARFKPIAASGVVSSFFTFAGPNDNGGNGKHNEIDIEFLGYNTSWLQANFWTNDDAYANGHEKMINLGFDATAAFHTYGFKWTSTGIEWWIDGARVHAVADSAADPTPKATESLQRIISNAWPVDSTASGWAGTFVYPGAPLGAPYDWIRYTSGESCSMTQAAPPPPTSQTGDPSVMHTDTITMSLISRNTQAAALVTVRNGLGQPVVGATVTGQWSGLVTGGDLSKVTGTDGSALFYSARSSQSGTFVFCTTGAALSGMTYDATANVETCDTVTK
ncbi:MAG TPA: family 16 glycosylhydrolase [Polyangia bacterium]|jgi:beta-glucanase (GH16 family)|nr:family 16 glycosylhydrolase [Polyangia bacterium]